MLRSWKFSAIVSAACLFVVPVQAQATNRAFVDLRYDIDPALQDCPSVLEFRSIIARELGYDPYAAGSSMGLAVRVRANETGLEAVIVWSIDAEKKGGERHFVARSEECRAMMTTVGFVAAVQIQLMANEESSELGPLPPSTAATPGGRSPSDFEGSRRDSEQARVSLSVKNFQVRSPPAAKGNEWMALVGAGPGVGIGLAPGALGFGRFFGGLQYRWLEVELGAEATLVSATREAYGGGFRHQLTLGTLASCAWRGPLSICALGKVGRIQAQGVGIDVPLSPKALFAQAGPRIAYALRLDEHLVLLAHLDALCSLTSWTLYLNHVAVWTMPRFAGVAGIDLAARF